MTDMSQSGNRFSITEVDGDLFSAPETTSLAHCVGADMVMGAGIAVQFRSNFGKEKELLSQKAQTGNVAILQEKDRYIYYLVTKDQSSQKPTYDSLRESLTAMKEHMTKNEVRKLAIPKLGCGIDGLEWEKVKAQLTAVFDHEDIDVTVYNFVPK